MNLSSDRWVWIESERKRWKLINSNLLKFIDCLIFICSSNLLIMQFNWIIIFFSHVPISMHSKLKTSIMSIFLLRENEYKRYEGNECVSEWVREGRTLRHTSSYGFNVLICPKGILFAPLFKVLLKIIDYRFFSLWNLQ